MQQISQAKAHVQGNLTQCMNADNENCLISNNVRIIQKKIIELYETECK